MTLSGWTRKLSGLPTMTVGSITLDQPFGVGTDDYAKHFLKAGAEQKLDYSGVEGIDRLMTLFERGEFDLVAVGRAMISNPDWATLVREHRLAELRPYSRDLLTSLD